MIRPRPRGLRGAKIANHPLLIGYGWSAKRCFAARKWLCLRSSSVVDEEAGERVARFEGSAHTPRGLEADHQGTTRRDALRREVSETGLRAPSRPVVVEGLGIADVTSARLRANGGRLFSSVGIAHVTELRVARAATVARRAPIFPSASRDTREIARCSLHPAPELLRVVQGDTTP
jgi:hypothetical protein